MQFPVIFLYLISVESSEYILWHFLLFLFPVKKNEIIARSMDCGKLKENALFFFF